MPTYKVLLMGESGVGKSSILLRLSEDRFAGEDVHAATIGVDYKPHVMRGRDNGPDVKLTIWDTAGQERFRTLTSSYYRGAHGVLLVYDVCSRASFDALQAVWLAELRAYADVDEMVLVVVGNKIDRPEGEREVPRADGEAAAKALSALYMECSAKTRQGVQAAFEELVHAIEHSPRLARRRQTAAAGVSLTGRQDLSQGAPVQSEGPCAC